MSSCRSHIKRLPLTDARLSPCRVTETGEWSEAEESHGEVAVHTSRGNGSGASSSGPGVALGRSGLGGSTPADKGHGGGSSKKQVGGMGGPNVALFAAVRKGSVKEVDAALVGVKKGGTVDARTPVGCTALHLAVWRNHIPIIHRLLVAGADPDTRVTAQCITTGFRDGSSRRGSTGGLVPLGTLLRFVGER